MAVVKSKMRRLALVVVIAMILVACRSTNATITEEKSFTALEHCLHFLITKDVVIPKPSKECCGHMHWLYNQATTTEDRQEICVHFKKFLTAYGPLRTLTPERVEELQSKCNLTYYVSLNAEADCTQKTRSISSARRATSR
ncbi:hypothetical protein QQ045_033655 [Rhodiola kirilowii]